MWQAKGGKVDIIVWAGSGGSLSPSSAPSPLRPHTVATDNVNLDLLLLSSSRV